MKINLVTTDTGWVLRNLADNYAKHLPNAKVSVEPDLTADINFYFNYVLFDHKTTIDVGYFTHRELHDEYLINKFDSTAREMDWCISMCNKTTEFLPKEKTTTIHPSPDPIFLNQKEKIIFGIIGKEKPSGRKRYDWIEKLREIEGVEILATNGEYEFSQMPEFYKKIDYVLILSDNEGGPLCLYEGLAMGVPVISSKVGAVEEFTTLTYETFDDLVNLIKGLIIPKNSWEIQAKEMMEVFNRLVEEKGNKI